MDGTVEVSFVPMTDIGENTVYFEVQNTKQVQDGGNSYSIFQRRRCLGCQSDPLN